MKKSVKSKHSASPQEKTLSKQTYNILDSAISDFLDAPPLVDWENDMEKHFHETKRLADEQILQ